MYKELERLRALLGYCQDDGWLTQNPVKSIKAPQVKDNPTLPLSDVEVAKVLTHRIIDAAQLGPGRSN
jgi:hypothetical protein